MGGERVFLDFPVFGDLEVDKLKGDGDSHGRECIKGISVMKIFNNICHQYA